MSKILVQAKIYAKDIDPIETIKHWQSLMHYTKWLESCNVAPSNNASVFRETRHCADWPRPTIDR